MKQAAEFIKPFEGYHRALKNGDCVPYLCPAKVLTIGWGTTGTGVAPGIQWTRQQAHERHLADVAKFAAGVARFSPILKDHPGAWVAVTSFAQNLGLGAYQRSTLRKAVDRGDWQEARNQINRWVNGGGRRLPGLVIRRAAEAALLPK